MYLDDRKWSISKILLKTFWVGKDQKGDCFQICDGGRGGHKIFSDLTSGSVVKF